MPMPPLPGAPARPSANMGPPSGARSGAAPGRPSPVARVALAFPHPVPTALGAVLSSLCRLLGGSFTISVRPLSLDSALFAPVSPGLALEFGPCVWN